MRSSICACRVAKTSDCVVMTADSYRFPRVRFCDVMMATESGATAFFFCSDGLDEYHFAVVVGKVRMLDDLRDESPQAERFLRGFEIEHEMYAVHISRLGDKVQPSEELLRDGEGRLPNGTPAYLCKSPFDNIRHLECVSQITLRLFRCQGFQIVFYGYAPFQFSSACSRP